jgi:hypothetical protein
MICETKAMAALTNADCKGNYRHALGLAGFVGRGENADRRSKPASAAQRARRQHICQRCRSTSCSRLQFRCFASNWHGDVKKRFDQLGTPALQGPRCANLARICQIAFWLNQSYNCPRRNWHQPVLDEPDSLFDRAASVGTVAVLVFLARAARAGLVAADLAPG